ncbi:PadR family transcriptional regulator [Paeniglutamicibacter gangotriensis]|uniref:PadR family transcriptional regulator n=1 Tax=Paeniglutamicibacter gangotriensis TaxID=254787 RepID=A0A5B0E387_9MICC|nr:PadR family transcriptional regulator [Paeniglutamicibacter gangotriensis]KAA0973557.1 PadR family transcriptional regulator [Paeniglutamicibacter gangotriensis]
MDTTQLLKGVLDVAVLAVLRDEDGYGYDIVRRLRAAGITEIGDASVYGTLRRLYAAGALSTYVVPSEGGPNRKYYALKDEGAAMLESQRATWNGFAAIFSTLINTPTPDAAKNQANGSEAP